MPWDQTDRPESPESSDMLGEASDTLAVEIRALAVLEGALNDLSGRQTSEACSEEVQGVEEALHRHRQRLAGLYQRIKHARRRKG